MAQVPEPVGPQQTPTVITNATIHVGNGQVIENASVAFADGKITYVGDAGSVNIDLAGYNTVDGAGKHIYPGLILPSTRLGLEEVGALRPTRDYAEVGDFNPNTRALVAYNTDSELIATMRFNGILLAQSTPESGVISGTSSIMALEGWNWEDAVYKANDGIHLNWPTRWIQGNFFNPERRKNQNYENIVTQIDEFLRDAKSYTEVGTPETVNLKMEAMKGLFSGGKKLFIHVDNAKEIVESIQKTQGYGIEGIVIVGGSDAWYVKDFLKDNNIPVLLGGVHRLPGRVEEDVDMPYKLPHLLNEAGILVGLAYNEGLQSSRNLPFFAGTAAAYGVDKEEALSMLTLNTAKILGIDAMAGSLETGKDAHIVVSEGDLLDMMTSKVTSAYITGRLVNLDGKQQMLYERFKEKYEEQGY